ncbi:MAG: hypothetical protein PWQ86_1814 [Bacillota bacterium]|nr:hypothetical protein [Bacillota bacterium]
MKESTRFWTRTAVLLGVTLVFQMLRQIIPMPQPVSVFVVGSLVNAALVVAAGVVGIGGGVIISVVAPVVAFLQGHLPPVPPMIPIVAAGNAAIVVGFALFRKKNPYLGVAVGAVVKAAFLYLAVRLLFTLITLKPPIIKALSFSFSWPQLVTALIGGVLAVEVLKLLPYGREEKASRQQGAPGVGR